MTTSLVSTTYFLKDNPMRYFYLALCLCGMICMSPFYAGAQGVEARFAGQQTVDGENAVAVTFSKALDARQNLAPYFSIRTEKGEAVDGAWILAKDPQVVYFSQVTPKTVYNIEVKKGLRAASGETLADPVTYEVTTRAAEPMLMFSSRGFILASDLSRGLPVDSLNIAQADIDFFRVRPDKVLAFKNQFWSDDYLRYYESDDLNRAADLVYSGRWDLDITKDLRTQVNIPITHIEALKTPGVYFAVLRGAGQYEYGYNTTWFTISDLGIHARVYGGDIRFFAQSLSSAAPVAAAKITGYTKKGKVLFSETTDETGQAVARGTFEDLCLVHVVKGSHITLMPMDVPDLDLSEFKTGKAPFRPVDLFVYGPRDIYRPGETVVMEGLLRNQDGGNTPGLPIQAKVIQPDGRMVREFVWNPGPQAHYHHAFSLPANALTGKWRVELTHGAGQLAPYAFVVAEFLPERMALSLAGGDEILCDPGAELSVALKGDFLYGAPAAGVRADARVHVKPARQLFKDKWPGYEFGAETDLLNTSFTTDDVRLDPTGNAALAIENQWRKITSPHWVTANVSLYDSGGRPVVRNWSWQVWPGQTLVGIRSLSGKDPGQVPKDSLARFEVMAVDAAGNRLAATGLEAVVIREHRAYYWEYKNGAWQWGSSSSFYPVDRFTLDIPAGKTATVDVPVERGGYRLEIRNPETGLASAYSIWAGWRPTDRGQGEMNRPDRVDITLDKPAYSGGDTARVTVKAPEGGVGYLFVDGKQNLLTLPITLPPEGKGVDISILPEWQRHDLYVSALVIRPGQGKTHDLPKRSVGLVPLPLDRGDRQLDLTIDAPERTEPGRTLTVPVALKTASGQVPEEAWVTLAAVDMGILNLTGFKTPSPFGFFFQERAYSPDLQDVYQKLIQANDGGYARQRFGGDAPVLNRGGDRPATDVRILSIQHGAVQTNGRGQAFFQLDLPEFDGSVRLMAVAHTDRAFGSAEKEMILASPLVIQAVMPRFLAFGDRSQMAVEIHNLTEDPQHLALAPSATGVVAIDTQSPVFLDLDPKQKQTVHLPLTAGNSPGRATLSCRISGLKAMDPDTGQMAKRRVDRSWFLETRPPYPAVTRIYRQAIAPGQTFAPDPSDLDNLVSNTIGISVSLGAAPPINLADHMARLFAYPYGCLEQTLSGLFPHVLLTQEDMADLGVSSGTREETAGKIDTGIQRLLEKQKSSGGFGLWDSSSPESAWLSAYACHFFILAHGAGFQVPKTAVEKAVKRMMVYVRQPSRIPYPGYVTPQAYRAAVRAYAAFVLAKLQSLTLGDARSVAAYVEKYARGSLAFVQAGTALTLAGDSHTASKAFDRAMAVARDEKRIGDYGSDVRDYAMAYYLLATYSPAYKNQALFIHELNTELTRREWLSTQERNALVMAGFARRKAQGPPWQAQLAVGSRKSFMAGRTTGQAMFVRGAAAGGFAVKNTGTADLYAHVILSGYPNTKPVAQNHGVKIFRRFLDINGTPLDMSRATSGDRYLVELKITPKKRMPNALVVDMIPAGVEVEDPNVSGAFVIDDILVDKKRVRDWQGQFVISHREFRDDRFAAALALRAGQEVRVFYGARVVSPGAFRVPAPVAEDMYRPYIRSVGQTLDRMTVVVPD